MAKRNKKQLADIRARMAAPVDPETRVELVRRLLVLNKEFLSEYEAGTHVFANRVELTASLIDLTRKAIAGYEAEIAEYEAKRARTD